MTLKYGNSSANQQGFSLICFMAIQNHWLLLSILLALLLLLAVLCNLIILVVIQQDVHLHKPMYYFLSYLSLVDLGLSLTTIPKILAIFWFHAQAIHFEMCLLQLFLVHSLTAMESAIFVVMAYDRYIAICYPLRYHTLITDRCAMQVIIGVKVKSILLFLPLLFLTGRLQYCSTNTIFYCYCENAAVVALACEDVTVNNLYLAVVAFLGIGTDFLCVAFSYIKIFGSILRLIQVGGSGKAFKTCGTHLILIVYFYSSLILLVLSKLVGQDITYDVHDLLAVLYCLVPPALNPLVYGLRTKEIRHSALKTLQSCSAALKWSNKLE